MVKKRPRITILRVCLAFRRDQTHTKANSSISSRTGSHNMEIKANISSSLIWHSKTKVTASNMGRLEDTTNSSIVALKAMILISIVATHSNRHMLRTRCNSNSRHMALRATTRVTLMRQLLISINKLQTTMLVEVKLNMGITISNSKCKAIKLTQPVKIQPAITRAHKAKMVREQRCDLRPRLAFLLPPRINLHSDFLLFISSD